MIKTIKERKWMNARDCRRYKKKRNKVRRYEADEGIKKYIAVQ